MIEDAAECPENMKRYSVIQDKLRAMTDIKSSALQDVAIIIEKFPCRDDYVPAFLENFVSYLKQLCPIEPFMSVPIRRLKIAIDASTVLLFCPTF